MDLPVRPAGVFRLLEVRKVATDKAFVGALDKNFKEFFDGIKQTERLQRKDDYLQYSKSHKKCKGLVDRPYNEMSEQELCSAKNGFMQWDYDETIGKVIDYQIPLRKSTETGEGTVDMISQKGNELYAIEAKKNGSRVSILCGLWLRL